MYCNLMSVDVCKPGSIIWAYGSDANLFQMLSVRVAYSFSYSKWYSLSL